MYINNFKVGFVAVFFTIVSFSSNTLNAQNQRPQTSSKQAQLKPIVIVPGKPRTIKVSPDQYAGIDFKSARLINPKINRSIKGFRVQAKRGDSRQCSPNPKCLMLTFIPPQKMPYGMFRLDMRGANNKRISLPVEIRGTTKQLTDRRQPVTSSGQAIRQPGSMRRDGNMTGRTGQTAEKLKQVDTGIARTNQDGSAREGVSLTGKPAKRTQVGTGSITTNISKDKQYGQNVGAGSRLNQGVYSAVGRTGSRTPATGVARTRPTINGIDASSDPRSGPGDKNARDSNQMWSVKGVLGGIADAIGSGGGPEDDSTGTAGGIRGSCTDDDSSGCNNRTEIGGKLSAEEQAVMERNQQRKQQGVIRGGSSATVTDLKNRNARYQRQKGQTDCSRTNNEAACGGSSGYQPAMESNTSIDGLRGDSVNPETNGVTGDPRGGLGGRTSGAGTR